MRGNKEFQIINITICQVRKMSTGENCEAFAIHIFIPAK